MTIRLAVTHPTTSRCRSGRARALRACAGASLLLAGVLLAACTRTGDFGRPQPPLFGTDETAPIVSGPGSPPIAPTASTDEERTLRKLAARLIANPGEPEDESAWASDLGPVPLREPPPFDRTAYATQLLSTPYRSATARYNRLIEDIRNDITRIGPFLVVARKVADLDHKREKGMAHIPVVSPGERAYALDRVTQNGEIIALVHRVLRQRAASYRFALERLVITLPSPQAVEADRTLGELEASLRQNSVAAKG